MKFWEVLRAVEEGKTVQYSPTISGKWVTISKIDVGFWSTNSGDRYEWRIKPEPMVIYRNLYSYGFYGPIHNTPKDAKKDSLDGKGKPVEHFIRTVKFVEVMED